MGTFTGLSGDRGGRYVEPDDDGLLVRGLLTATASARVGGRHEVPAATAGSGFRRPVYTGRSVRRRAVYAPSGRRGDGDWAVAADATAACTCGEEARVVLRGKYEGTIRAADA